MVYPLGILFGDQENPFWQEQILWYRKFLPEYPFQAEFFFADPPRDAEAQAAKQAAQKAAEEELAAKRAQAASTPYWQNDSGVKNEVSSAVQQSQSHMPQTPTLSGGMYPTYGGSAAATAQKEQD